MVEARDAASLPSKRVRAGLADQFVMSSQGFGKTLAAHHNYTLMLRKNSSSQRAQRLHRVHKEKLPRREKKRSWLLTDWV